MSQLCDAARRGFVPSSQSVCCWFCIIIFPWIDLRRILYFAAQFWQLTSELLVILGSMILPFPCNLLVVVTSRETAKFLAGEGASVILGCRSADRGLEAAADIREVNHHRCAPSGQIS